MIATDELVKEMNDTTNLYHDYNCELWYFVHIDTAGKSYKSQMFAAEKLAMYAWQKNFIDWQ